MSETEFNLLIAVASGLAVFGIAQLVIGLLNRDRQRLSQRLTGDWTNAAAGAGAVRAIVVELQIPGLPPGMAKRPFVQSLNRKLLHAFPEAKLTHFLGLMGMMGLVGFVAAAVAMDSLIAGMLAGAGAGYAPMMAVGNRRARRQRRLADQLPEAIDFLSRILRAGHSLSTGIQMMGKELPAPIGPEFRRCYDQHSLGQSLEQSMREMSARIDSAEFAFFVTAILIQRQTGGDLSEVLRNISSMIRARIRLSQHVRAITAEGRFTGYILAAFPSVLFVISYFINPEYGGILLRTDIGKLLLGGAIGLQMLGLVVIRRIVTVRV